MIKTIFKAFAFLFLFAGPLMAQDTWRSPRMLSDQWPLNSAAECAAYGAGYGYAECAGVSKRPASVAAAPTKAPAKKVVKPTLQVQPGHLNASSRLIAPPPLPSLRPAYVGGSCAENMKLCFSQCTGAGNLGAMCNETCSTQTQCSSSLKLNYVQFLDMQTEISQFVRSSAQSATAPGAVAKAPEIAFAPAR